MTKFAMNVFDFSFTRQEMIQVLDKMGVSIPRDSKMSDEALDKRLGKALDASQAIHSLLPQPRINVVNLKPWPADWKVFDAIRRGNPDEAMKCIAARLRGGDPNPYPLYTNAFMDFRQTLMTVGKNVDEGVKSVLVKDLKGETNAICMRILGVYMLKPNIPLIVLLYMSANLFNAICAAQWTLEQHRRAKRQAWQGLPLATILTMDLESKLLLRVLTANAKYLPEDFSPKKFGLEDGFKPSFLLPAGPLNLQDLGKLNADFGCAVCGKKSSKRCSQCQSASYCSGECQRVDWPTHKRSCRSLRGGTWVTLPFLMRIPGLEGMVGTGVNRFSSGPENITIRTADDNAPPPNIHGDKTFLVKIQRGITHRGNLLIYDRQRSFQVWSIESSNPHLYRRIEQEMQRSKPEHLGFKMYRWAKRTDDLELTVCVDREPIEEIKW